MATTVPPMAGRLRGSRVVRCRARLLAEVRDLRTVEAVSLRTPRRADSGRPSSTPTADAELASYVSRAQSGNLEALPALSAFMRQMERYPQLTPDAQGELVGAYQESMALKAALEAGELRGGQRGMALRKIRQGERHLEHIVASNFRLVWLIAREQAVKRYPARDRLAEVLPDLVSEGNMALTKAAQDFNPSLSPSFPTYAARVVRDRVRYILSRQSAVPMSASWSRIQRITRNLLPELTAEFGRPATMEELQDALLEKCMEWAESKLTPEQSRLPERERHELKLSKLKKQGMIGAIRDIEEVMRLAQPLASLDAPVGDGEGASLQDMIVDQGDDSLFDPTELGELREAIEEALSTLPERDRQIILYRYGFVDGETWTFNRISEMFGVTAERIRQIDRAVLNRLRSPQDQYSNLSSFLPDQFD